MSDQPDPDPLLALLAEFGFVRLPDSPDEAIYQSNEMQIRCHVMDTMCYFFKVWESGESKLMAGFPTRRIEHIHPFLLRSRPGAAV